MGKSMIDLHPLYQANPKSKIERTVRMAMRGAAWIALSIALFILAFVLWKGLTPFIVNDGSIFVFLTGHIWDPGAVNGLGKPLIGALPLILGSFSVTILSVLAAAPIAIGAAIFINEISPRLGKTFLQPVLELLIGIPSVVYGFLGLSMIVPLIRNYIGGSGFGVAAAVVVLSAMMLPTVTCLAVNALRRVPPEFREASLALGATRWQTISRMVMTIARPDLCSAVIFGISRAFGESLAVQMVIGNAVVIPDSLFQPAATITSILTMGMGNTVMGQTENNALWSLALILLAMSCIFMIFMRLTGKRRTFS